MLKLISLVLLIIELALHYINHFYFGNLDSLFYGKLYFYKKFIENDSDTIREEAQVCDAGGE